MLPYIDLVGVTTCFSSGPQHMFVYNAYACLLDKQTAATVAQVRVSCDILTQAHPAQHQQAQHHK